jgi:hypothetical protein
VMVGKKSVLMQGKRCGRINSLSFQHSRTAVVHFWLHCRKTRTYDTDKTLTMLVFNGELLPFN